MKNKERSYWIPIFLLLALLLLIAVPAVSQDQPTLAKDTLRITAYTNPSYRGNWDTWSWVPYVEFRVNGPIASGGQLSMEFSLPGSGTWIKFDCPTGTAEKGHWWETKCGGYDLGDGKGTTHSGPVNFAIRLRNELNGTNATLFTGKIKVGRLRTGEKGPKAANHWVYNVDHDWTLPIGYVFLEPDQWEGWNMPLLKVVFWVRGKDAKLDPHLFYQGKEVRNVYQGQEVGTRDCRDAVTLMPSRDSDIVGVQGKWEKETCIFWDVKGWNKSGRTPSVGSWFVMSQNPGDYEIKVLWNGHLARSIKFTVAPDGKFDNGIATTNQLGSDRVIVPVQVLGSEDEAWDRTAWKTWAFYGNPLTGFTTTP